MALMKTIIIPSGVDISMLSEFNNSAEKVILKISKELPNTYIKICNTNGNKDLINLLIEFKETKDSNTICLKEYEFIPSVADGAANFIEQAYLYLKTLPEYADAIDC